MNWPSSVLTIALLSLTQTAGTAAAAGQKPDLLQLSEQADQLDKLEFDAAIERANTCTRARNFRCSESELAKAAKVANTSKDKAALAASRTRLANERQLLAEEQRRAEELWLAEQRRQEEERQAQLRLEREREREAARLAREEEEEQERQERQARREREADDAASTRSAWAGVADQIRQRGAENMALLNKLNRDTSAALARANQVRAEQAAERERASAERAERAAEQRREAAREREQRLQVAEARREEDRRAEQRRASEAAAERERAAEQAASRERERQRLAAEQQEKQERARKAEAERIRLAQEQAERNAAEQREKREYLDAMVRGIHLVATQCLGGEGHYFATGVLPKQKPKGDYCIDVHYEASCPGSAAVSTGVAKNFLGMSGCAFETFEIDPKPGCKVKEVRIRVTDVTFGCG